MWGESSPLCLSQRWSRMGRESSREGEVVRSGDAEHRRVNAVAPQTAAAKDLPGRVAGDRRPTATTGAFGGGRERTRAMPRLTVGRRLHGVTPRADRAGPGPGRLGRPRRLSSRFLGSSSHERIAADSWTAQAPGVRRGGKRRVIGRSLIVSEWAELRVCALLGMLLRDEERASLARAQGGPFHIERLLSA